MLTSPRFKLPVHTAFDMTKDYPAGAYGSVGSRSLGFDAVRLRPGP